MNLNEEKIKELLGLGLDSATVASAVGVTTSYVAQLLSDEVFAADVAQLKLVNFADHAKRDRKYDALEDTFLDKLEGMVHLMARPQDVLRAIAVVNAAKRRTTPDAGAAGNGAGSSTHVTINLPNCMAAQVIINPNNQVVEVGGRTVASMPASGVAKQLEELQERRTASRAAAKEDSTQALTRVAELTKTAMLPVPKLADML